MIKNKLELISLNKLGTFFIIIFLMFMFNNTYSLDFNSILDSLKNGSAGGLSIGRMFANFDLAGRAFIIVVRTLAVVLGVFYLFDSAVSFVKASEQKENIFKPIVTLIVSVLLINFGVSVDMLSATFGFVGLSSGIQEICDLSTAVITCSGTNTSLDKETKAIQIAIITIIRLVGYISIVKGLLLLNQMGKANGGGGGQGGKSFFHILGGVICINITFFALALGNTIAPNSDFVNDYLKSGTFSPKLQ